jgi:hypothetical protein
VAAIFDRFLSLRSAIAPVHSLAGVDADQQRRHAGTDVADQRRGDGHVAVDLGRGDVDLDELLGVGRAPGLALAMRQQPVQAGADQHHDIGLLQHVGARGGRRQCMVVGQQALGHRHRQVGNAGLLDQRTDVGIGAGVGCPFAEQDQRPLGALQQRERAPHGVGRRDLARRRVDDLDQRLPARRGVHRLPEQLGRQVEVDAAGPAGQRRADGACNADPDVLGVQHAVGRLAQGFGDGELVHFLVVALLQVDDLALARSADQDHREAVDRRIGQRGQAVEEARCRHGQADAGLAGQEAGGGSGIAGMLLVTKRDDPQARGLRLAGEVGDRNAG